MHVHNNEDRQKAEEKERGEEKEITATNSQYKGRNTRIHRKS
jgi:hypothetical protein